MKSKHLSWVAILLAAGFVPVYADTTVFVSRGEQGEITFSDAHSPGAQSIDVMTGSDSATPESSEERVRFMLEVADSLADARREREADRARLRNERAATVQETPVVVEQQPVYYPLAHRPYYPYRHGYQKPRRRPDHGNRVDEPQAPERPSRSFRFTPDL